MALFDGKSVQKSFSIARAALEASPYVPNSVLEGEKFILLPEYKPSPPINAGSIDSSHAAITISQRNMHEKAIFKCKLVKEWPEPGVHILTGSNSYNFRVSGELSLASMVSFTQSASYTLPPPLPDFVGREVDICKVIDALLKRRLVSLVGPSGIG